ncbi:GrpB family protein [Paenibacillus nasutitermitis]|uniref:GrpB family protein n=1 Tax=Paenibacillus nasutitermitis TaxID=1652958 RepID=A0A916ZAT6_9BACL|nr:GrpB family protein [Paenibacillus nasutitermitis]GGD82834.1 hypothetical protein GCM10010911_46270 [Paenibacillus nasutitermitis]
MDCEVTIAEYNPGWVAQFEQEQAKLQAVLPDKSIVIEHIGSTSVEGLPSKPILDIAIGVHDLEEADAFITPLGELDYEYVPKADFPNRKFFRKGKWRRGTHHLHVYELGSEEWNNNLLFRNYLRNHPEKVQEYARLKRQLASLHADDRETYTKLKAPFIHSILDLAGSKI